MVEFWAVVAGGSLAGLLATYLFYPLALLGPWGPRRKQFAPAAMADPPSVEILFAAYNEEPVLPAKLESILALDYPPDKLSIRVGSDCSNDGTNALLQSWAAAHPGRVQVHLFRQRRGKARVLNDLRAVSKADFLLLTDANILYEKDCLVRLLEGIDGPEVAACGGQIQYLSGASPKGIANQESRYLSLENRIKARESSLWGLTIGLEGGCYLVRRELFPTLPAHFFMEDFFVTLHLLGQGYRVHFNPAAKVWEDVSVSPQEEFRRKVRISIGNWQNLGAYGHLLWQRPWPLGAAFFLHKVLRWCSPFFLLLLALSLPWLWPQGLFWRGLAVSYLCGGVLGSLGLIGSKLPGLTWLRYPGHFLFMNLALLWGFFKYLKGVKSNVWQPTQRNQT